MTGVAGGHPRVYYRSRPSEAAWWVRSAVDVFGSVETLFPIAATR